MVRGGVGLGLVGLVGWLVVFVETIFFLLLTQKNG